MARKPARKPVRSPARGGASAREDIYINQVSGHGTTRDRRTFTRLGLDVVTDVEAIDAWRTDDMLARIIELPPREATRAGFTLKVGGKDGKQIAEGVMAEVERLNVLDRVKVAGQWERAYSGAGIMPVLDGAVGELDEPLDLTDGRITRVDALHLLEPRELRPVDWYRNIRHPKWRKPERYQLWPLSSASGFSIQSERIHESRLVIFPGIQISNQLQPGQRPGWGDSVLSRVRAVAADYGLSWASAATLIHDFARGVYKLEGYANIMRRKGGREEILARVAAMERDGSSLRGVIIDGKDDYSRTTTPIGGLAEMLMQFAQRMAAAADMPVTVLMGMSPAGMNATGESDIRGWYDRIAAIQTYYRDMVEQIIRLIMLQVDGPCAGVEPESWSIEWTPLWQPSAKEQADTRKTIAETDAIYIENQVVSSKTVAQSRWGGDTFSSEMSVDPAELEQDDLSVDPAGLSPEELAAMGRVADPTGAAAAAPTDPAPAPTTDPAAEIVALNGAQVSSLVDVVKAAVNKEIPRESAQAIIALAFQIPAAQASALLGPAGFAPAVPPDAAPAPAPKPAEAA